MTKQSAKIMTHNKSIKATPCIVLLFTAVTTLFAHANEPAVLDDLRPLLWKNRIVLLWSDTPKQDYQRLINTYKKDIVERDMLLFVFNNQALATNYPGRIGTKWLPNIKAKFANHRHRYFLIGKDGGTKDQGQRLDIVTIFAQIDAMPMRQREMGMQD